MKVHQHMIQSYMVHMLDGSKCKYMKYRLPLGKCESLCNALSIKQWMGRVTFQPLSTFFTQKTILLYLTW